jgi:hypothetical protein
VTAPGRDLSTVTRPPCPAGPHAHDAAEAALLLRCKESWLKEQSRLRLIPFTLLGGAYHYTDRHLDRILAQFEQLPAPPADGVPAGRKPWRKAPSARPAEPEAAGGITLLQARPPRRRAS